MHVNSLAKTYTSRFIFLGVVVLDKRENKYADIGRFELAYRDNPHPGFKCVDNKFYLEGARIRKLDLQRYSELDKKTRQREKSKVKEKKKQEEEERAKAAKNAEEQTSEVDDEKVQSSNIGIKEDSEEIATNGEEKNEVKEDLVKKEELEAV